MTETQKHLLHQLSRHGHRLRNVDGTYFIDTPTGLSDAVRRHTVAICQNHGWIVDGKLSERGYEALLAALKWKLYELTPRSSSPPNP